MISAAPVDENLMVDYRGLAYIITHGVQEDEEEDEEEGESEDSEQTEEQKLEGFEALKVSKPRSRHWGLNFTRK